MKFSYAILLSAVAVAVAAQDQNAKCIPRPPAVPSDPEASSAPGIPGGEQSAETPAEDAGGEESSTANLAPPIEGGEESSTADLAPPIEGGEDDAPEGDAPEGDAPGGDAGGDDDVTDTATDNGGESEAV
ncbi:hypothetical protein H4R24_000863 [Coemansia sp. RSA 988]|nr:hypothetical protein H4R24_000863 [Coemansia sp. RSA 988]